MSAAPRFGSVNLVVADVAAATRFLEALGVSLVPVPTGWAEWADHHRTVAEVATDLDADIDSRAFAHWWGGIDDHASGVVVNLRVDARDDVDRLHARALELGAAELRAPHDAFWGARYSVVQAPGPLAVGLMSERDPDRNVPPPSIEDIEANER